MLGDECLSPGIGLYEFALRIRVLAETIWHHLSFPRHVDDQLRHSSSVEVLGRYGMRS